MQRGKEISGSGVRDMRKRIIKEISKESSGAYDLKHGPGGIPGINRSKADQLLDNFNTIKSIANAEPTDISEIPGFGKTLANRIHKLMNHDFKEDDSLE